jgi:hypothetical protein
MTAPTIETTNRATPPLPRQIAAFLRMELLLLRRNPTATLLSVVTPLVVGVLLISGDYDHGGQMVVHAEPGEHADLSCRLGDRALGGASNANSSSRRTCREIPRTASNVP